MARVAPRPASGSTGTHIAQACATSVACIVSAAMQVEQSCGGAQLVVAADRTSNGPLLVYPRSQGMGGSPTTEHWVLDSFAADPNTAQSMVATAENVAREGGMSRAELDELTLMRWEQYRRALQDDRAVQRRYFEPVEIPLGKGKSLRGIAELIQALQAAWGGVGVFTGCAAGDTGAALVLRVD